MCTGMEIAAIGSVAQGVGGFIQQQNLAEQYERRADEILSNSIENMRISAKQRERARGSLRAAYGKAGVTLTGTAKVVSEEQLRQDELALLNEKYNAQLAITQAQDEAKKARFKAISGVIGSGTQAFGQFSGGK